MWKRLRIPLAAVAVTATLMAALFLTVGTPVHAARYTSPPAKVSATIGGQTITVDYYAPSAHGRKIMGGLVPFGQVWCTGANYATKITTPAALEMGSLKLPKGAYSIWTVPGEKGWTLIINKQTGQFHLDYDQSLDFGRTKMSVKTLSSPVETFRVELRPAGANPASTNQGVLALMWEKTEASIPFTVLR